MEEDITNGHNSYGNEGKPWVFAPILDLLCTYIIQSLDLDFGSEIERKSLRIFDIITVLNAKLFTAAAQI